MFAYFFQGSFFYSSTCNSKDDCKGRFMKQYNSAVVPPCPFQQPETAFNDKHSVWDFMPEMAITSLYVDSRVDSNSAGDWCTGNPMPESTLSLCQSRLNPTVRNLEFWDCCLYITQQFLSTINTHNFWFCAGFLMYQYMFGQKVIGIF